ncbi:MAG: hypothetical protein H7301_10415 [Cryobacterium sp.]|nr:hypothetical protein [Oligoflexia bacterium]
MRLSTVRLSAFSFVAFLGLSLAAQAGSRPLALVYKGPGSCVSDGHCSEAAAAVADRAGFDVEFVGPKSHDMTLFREAAVYIQPGGNSTEVGEAMTEGMKRLLRDFVAEGGGYVGFCAGGFFAMSPFPGYPRLGLIRGDADGLEEDSPSIVSVSWTDGLRHHVYWEGGPFFILPRSSNFEVVSRYALNRKPASIRGEVGQGRVWVSGYHPEAPYDWRFHPTLEDSDGTKADLDMAVEMIRWSARAHPMRSRLR